MEVPNTVQEVVIKSIHKKRNCKPAKWLSEEALQIDEKRRETYSRHRKIQPLPYCLPRLPGWGSPSAALSARRRGQPSLSYGKATEQVCLPEDVIV